MFAYNSYYGKVFVTDNVIVVRDNQTVQQVLDSITDASETNKYLVLVPSGHELEYFDWKPNVEVKFLDNLDERWQLDELEGWDDLSNWQNLTPYASIGLENYEGGKRLKVSSGQYTPSFDFLKPLDLRKYQGILFDVWFEVPSGGSWSVRLKVYFSDSEFIGSSDMWSNQGEGFYHRTVFLPFGLDINNFNYVDVNNIDWSSVKLRFLTQGMESGNVCYFSNFRLVRTFPYPAIFMRTDDSGIIDSLRVEALRELERRNIPVIWAIIAGHIHNCSIDDNRYPTPELLQDFHKGSVVSIVNHSLTHPRFDNIVTDNETNKEVFCSRYIFERLGLKDALRWWVNPNASMNSTLEKLLRSCGYMCTYPHFSPVPVSTYLGTDKILTNFRPLKKGGIHTYLFHSTQVADEDSYNEWLSQINELSQFCRFISIRDIERLMNNSQEKFSPKQTKPTLFQVLDSDFDMYFYHKQLFLDPNGTDRNINVQPYELRPGDPALIVNTGSTGNLIFDPSGLNLTIQPGQSANVIYDGDQWRQICGSSTVSEPAT